MKTAAIVPEIISNDYVAAERALKIAAFYFPKVAINYYAMKLPHIFVEHDHNPIRYTQTEPAMLAPGRF